MTWALYLSIEERRMMLALAVGVVFSLLWVVATLGRHPRR